MVLKDRLKDKAKFAKLTIPETLKGSEVERIKRAYYGLTLPWLKGVSVVDNRQLPELEELRKDAEPFGITIEISDIE